MKTKGGLSEWIWAGPKYRREPLPLNDWDTGFFERVEIAPASRIVQIGAGDRAMTRRLAAAAPKGFVLALEYGEKQFAEALNTSQSSIPRIEKGEQNLTTNVMERIGKVLGRSILTLHKKSDDFRIIGGRKLSGTITTNTSKNGRRDITRLERRKHGCR